MGVNMTFDNSEYEEQIMQQIASESENFRVLLAGLLKDTNNQYPTNEAWLGTIALGEKKHIRK
jgi:hypothetical protein